MTSSAASIPYYCVFGTKAAQLIILNCEDDFLIQLFIQRFDEFGNEFNFLFCYFSFIG